MKLYLITGFLGSGKSTFLKNFIRLFPDQRIYLIINEFGREGVDGKLFAELDAQLAEINNGSIFCSCRIEKFEEILRSVVGQRPDTILVEASGLADPTGVNRVIGSIPQIEYAGSVCLCDALRLHKVLSSSRSAAKQLAVSSLALVNKTDLADEGQIALTESLIRGINPDTQVERTSFGHIAPEWLGFIKPLKGGGAEDADPDLTLQKAITGVNSAMTPTQLGDFLRMFCAETYRIKGFVRLGETVYLADCVGSDIKVTPWSGSVPESTGYLVILSGRGMAQRKALNAAAKAYPGLITSISYG